ncbi:DEAD/DEAH box helicase family protein [Phoenicibacter congonensis]|uniref:DEAD/DEAH box helicase family protein n=1 Tax=Phoenicibacter congonensis TaxID=1944646 RepID=UPI001E47F410|nr:DEAD/DEAH box helicase family protein [Phoenicibacter congonensis]
MFSRNPKLWILVRGGIGLVLNFRKEDANHIHSQYFAERKAIESTKLATVTDGKGSVFWHTQGSGKSLSMVFYSHLLQEALDSPTIVVLADRNNLDDYLFGQLAKCKDFLRQDPMHAQSRENLRDLLAGRQANGIIFRTIKSGLRWWLKSMQKSWDCKKIKRLML